MSKVQIFIDGKQVIADSSQTILAVCREQGIDIPTLCYDDQLEPFTSCFLCVVQVQGARTLVPSCGTKIQQGMRITTNNDNIWNARKMALELILSNHYADCLGPCRLTCPAGVDVQGYLALAAMGKYREAIELIKRNNPLPTVCGRVCTRPCEMNCRRNFVDEAAAIDHVKRFIADIDINSSDRYFPELKKDSGHRVAVVGAGPAGLSCAYYLRQEGHQVDIFDAKSKAGGMLRWGIPQYRLPEEIIDKEVEGITELGVKLHLNQALGRDYSIDDLFDRGYESIFLGLGAQASTSMRVENEDAEGVLSGIDFLEDIKLKKISSLEGKVAVIGGGNTAMDAARSALRLGADEVHIVYRRTIQEMPANKMEVDEAEEEGVIFTFLTAPVKVTLDGNRRARGIECIKMELGPPDDSGRRRPIPVEDSNFEINVDWVIAAIGQKPDLKFAGKDERLVNIKQTRWGTLEVRPHIMDTNIPGVFAGGDVVLGAATAIEAIADGKKAAEAMHKYLTGQKLDIPKRPFISQKDHFKKISSDDFISVAKTTRAKMAVRDPQQRRQDWNEIELGFTPDQVFNEAIRCLECGCQAFYECDLQKHSTEYEAGQNNYPGEFHDILPDKTHPFIQIELNKCILCGRCVRICDEVVGLGVYGFVNRGFKAKVKPALEIPLAETSCISCGQCVETCPTGAIIDKVDATKPGPWILKKYPTLCQYCSVGCRMNVDVMDNRVLKISADKSALVNEFGNLCVKGRYGFRYVNDENRIRSPFIRKNGNLEEVSWEEALDFAANKIKKMIEAGEEWAVVGSPQVTNEENYLLQKFGRTELGTNNIGSFSFMDEYPEQLLRASMSNTTFEKIEKSDFIMVCNFDPMETHPVLYMKLQKAARRGQTLYMGCCPDSRLARKSNSLNIPDDKKVLFLQYLVDMVSRSDWYEKVVAPTRQEKSEILFSSVSGISRRVNLSEFNLSKGEFNQFFKKLLKAKYPVFLCNRDHANPEIIHWLNSLGFILGQSESFLSVSSGPNLQGMLDMGIHPEYLPGYQRVDNSAVRARLSQDWESELSDKTGIATIKVLEKINAGNIKGIFLWSQDPAGTGNLSLKRSPDSFMIVADIFMTDTAKDADCVFPLVPFVEQDGSITNSESRIQYMKQAIPAGTGKQNWTILTELSSRLGSRLKFDAIEDIIHEIRSVVPEYRKEIAVFRNGYIPNQKILKESKKHFVLFGANYLQKWMESLVRGIRVNSYRNISSEIPVRSEQ
jgi:formate dehydrogenase major subunit